MMNTLEKIQTLVDTLAEKINAPKHLLPTYGRTEDGARPHIEIDSSGQLYFVVVERGEELQRDLAPGIDDLLFMIFDSVTFSMACKIKVPFWKKHLDTRRHFFLEQEELLGKLNPQWEMHRRSEHDHILQLHPFDDHSNTRADYCVQLTKTGISNADAWIEACKKYPLPETN